CNIPHLVSKEQPQVLYLEAGKHERDRNYDKAKEIYEKIIKDFPGNGLAIKANDRLLLLVGSDERVLKLSAHARKKYSAKERALRLAVIPFYGEFDRSKQLQSKLLAQTEKYFKKYYPDIVIVSRDDIRLVLQDFGKAQLDTAYTDKQLKELSEALQVNTLIFGNVNHLSLEVVKNIWVNTFHNEIKFNIEVIVYDCPVGKEVFRKKIRRRFAQGLESHAHFVNDAIRKAVEYGFIRFFKNNPEYFYGRKGGKQGKKRKGTYVLKRPLLIYSAKTIRARKSVLRKSANVRVMKISGDWIQIRSEEGNNRKGWVKMNKLKKVSDWE
ncbi:tol-pal system YbgF family protein, partial [Candidatus Riflebacteria bacterium]